MKSPVYLAGSWADRPRLRGIRDELAEMGIVCCSSWLDHGGDENLPEWAVLDLAEVLAANVVILFTEVPSSAGGMHFESGFAYALRKQIIGAGPRTCLFHNLIADSDWYPAWPELRAALGEMTR